MGYPPPANFNGFRVLAALLHGTPVVGVSQTLRRWTEVTSCIRQGDHHVGRWPWHCYSGWPAIRWALCLSGNPPLCVLMLSVFTLLYCCILENKHSLSPTFYTVSQKKGATLTMAITLSILGGFAKCFTVAKSSKFQTKQILGYPPYLKYVAALPWKTHGVV